MIRMLYLLYWFNLKVSNQMDKILEQIIVQFPVVAILLYNNIRQDERFNDLLTALLSCLKSKVDVDNDE